MHRAKIVVLLVIALLGLKPALDEMDTVIDVHSESSTGHMHADFQGQEHHHGDSDDHHHSKDGPCHHQSHCCCQHSSTFMSAESLTAEDSKISIRHALPGSCLQVRPDTHVHFHPPRA